MNADGKGFTRWYMPLGRSIKMKVKLTLISHVWICWGCDHAWHFQCPSQHNLQGKNTQVCLMCSLHFIARSCKASVCSVNLRLIGRVKTQCMAGYDELYFCLVTITPLGGGTTVWSEMMLVFWTELKKLVEKSFQFASPASGGRPHLFLSADLVSSSNFLHTAGVLLSWAVIAALSWEKEGGNPRAFALQQWQ